jgi:hypothetical protein
MRMVGDFVAFMWEETTVALSRQFFDSKCRGVVTFGCSVGLSLCGTPPRGVEKRVVLKGFLGHEERSVEHECVAGGGGRQHGV